MLMYLYWSVILITGQSYFATCQSCPQSASTLMYVESCPKNLQEWENAAQRKDCSSVQQTWYCLEYNERGSRLQENYNSICKDFPEPCPDSYISTDIYKYQGCYEFATKQTKNNNTNEPSEDNERVNHTISYVLVGIIVPVVALIVLGGSLLTVWVYKRRKRRSTTNDSVEEVDLRATPHSHSAEDERTVTLYKFEGDKSTLQAT